MALGLPGSRQWAPTRRIQAVCRLGSPPGSHVPRCWLHAVAIGHRRSPLRARWAGGGGGAGVGGGLPPPPPRRPRAAFNEGDGAEEPEGSRDDSSSLAALAELQSKLSRLGRAFKQAVQALWQAQRRWLQHSLARLALGLGVLLAAVSAAANWWGVRAINSQLLPKGQDVVASLLQREVQLGAVRWVSPLGLAGLGPLASLGPVSVGAGPVERSSAHVQRVAVGLDLLQSALQRRVVLTVKAHGAQVNLVQASNFSWFGYPEDTEPSARNFLPGAGGSGGEVGATGGGSGGEGSSASNDNTGASSSTGGGAGSANSSGSTLVSSRQRRRRNAAAPAGGGAGAAAPAAVAGPATAGDKARQRMEALAAEAVGGSTQLLQSLVDRLTQELLAQGVVAAAADSVAGEPGALAAEPPRHSTRLPSRPQELLQSQPQPQAQAQASQPQPQASQQQQAAASQERPTVVLMGLGGSRPSMQQQQQAQQQQAQQQPAVMGSSQVLASSSGPAATGASAIRECGGNSNSSSRGAADLLFAQRQPSGKQRQEVARVAPGGAAGGSGSSGMFGGMITWGGRGAGPAPQQPQPPQQPQAHPHPELPSGGLPSTASSSRRQQQLAVLNAMRLQAGRGFSLAPGPAAGVGAGSAGGGEQEAGADAATAAHAGTCTDASSSGGGSSSSSSSSATIIQPEPQQSEQLEPAGHRSSTAPRSSEQQEEPQHRKLRRRRGPLHAQAPPPLPLPQQQQFEEQGSAKATAAAAPVQLAAEAGAEAAAAEQPSFAAATAAAAAAAHSAVALALAGSTTRSGSSSSKPGVPLRRPRALPGTAASLNKQLKPLALRSSSSGGKLYSARGAANHPWQSTPAIADAEAAKGQASGTCGSADLTAGHGDAGAGAADVLAATSPMSAEQRRAAVAAINRLPPIVAVRVGRKRRAQEQADTALPGSGSDGVSAADRQSKRQAAESREAASAATRRINALGVVHAPDSLQPSARVAEAARGAFASMVVDPATLHKKGGSASLPWAHQRPPATSLIGSRLGGPRHARQAEEEAATGGAAAATAEHAVEGAAATAVSEGAFHLEAPPSSGSSSSSTEAGPSGHRRLPLVHPGYFSPTSGPSYTPAPPEALIDARNRRTTLGMLLRGALEGALQRLHMPEIALGEIQVSDARVDAHVHGEALPRRFQDVRVKVRLGARYDTLRVELSAVPQERHPSSYNCTMLAPHAHRHLRHVTGAAAARAYREHLAAAAAGDARAAALALAAAEGWDLPTADDDDPAAAAAVPLSPADAYAGAPTGGRVEIAVEASSITSGAVPQPGQPPVPGLPVPALDIRVRGHNLHAPIIERLIELPMDINAGRVSGQLRIRSHDPASWHFPEFTGRVSVRDAVFHFWDATDDITGACLDLLFERTRLYLHNATGRFGAVDMTLTGDLDLNPESGQYRLSATIPGVEVNQLRASLGVRPTPQPVAGAVAGVLHVTGPLEKPVFAGTARGVRPSPAQLAGCEPTDALAALAGEPRAVGAYDRVPLAGACAVFALDTAAESLELHALHTELLDGGKLRGSGRMWVAPRAEMDPSAVSITAEARDLAVEAVARRYLPEGMALPPGIILGRASLSATMQGSHMEPTLEVALSLPEAKASCSATLRREAMRLSMTQEKAEGSATLHLAPPGFDSVKAAITQAQATALARPNVAGLDADVSLNGLDVVPLVSGKAALHQLAVQQSGQPVRLRPYGRVRVSGTVQQQQQQQQQQPQPGGAAAGAAAEAAGAQAAPGGSAGASGAGSSWQFFGELGLENMRINQLKLFQKLAGRLLVSDSGVSVHGKGLLRAHETLDLDLTLPLLAPTAATPAAVQPAQPWQLTQQQQQQQQAVAASATAAAAAAVPPADEPAPSEAQTPAPSAGGTAAGAADAPAASGSPPAELEAVGAEGGPRGGAAAPAPEAAAGAGGQAEPAPAEAQRPGGGGRLQLRCGPLQVAADVNAPGSQLNFKVAAVKLDELELASLRGDLQEVSCSLNFESHTGRGKLALSNPRYSGLRGDSLSGGFRWERDVVRLEKLVLVQQRSRYEVQGEYTLPPNTPLPSSAADLTLQPGSAASGHGPVSARGAAVAAVPAGGRWRVQVLAPAAELQEIIPAARLLQSATSLSPAEYERAKASFLHAIERTSMHAAELNTQLRAMAKRLAPASSSADAGSVTGRRGDASRGAAASTALQLPGLQDVRGQWSGSIQAYGGGSSATSCDFDVKGQGWQWGSYSLDALVAAGSYHSEEGVQLQEFVLKAADAKLLVRGSLLGEHQDASLLLTDFPMSTLQPIFRAVPALQHAAPAVPAERPPPVSAPRPLGMLTNALGRAATKGLRGEGGAADSPINGLLYINGKIAGSRAQPTGEVAVRLYDSAVGPTRLSQAQASARLSEHQQLSFNIEVVPAEGHRQSGYVKAAGVVPLGEVAGAGAAAAGNAGSGGSSSSSGGAAPSSPAAQQQQAAPGQAAGVTGQQQPTPSQQVQQQQAAQQAQQQQLDVRLSVKDGGMALLTSITPDLRWQSGQAAVDVRLRGSLERPVLSGSASISRATLDCPSLLRWPLTNVAAEVRAGGGMLTVESLEARSGRRGTLRLRGSLPVYAAGSPQQERQAGGQQQQQQAYRLVAEASGLELRLRNMYSGQYDAGLVLSGSLASPTVAGSMRFSKGIVFIVPQGAPDVAGTASGASGTLLTPSGMGPGGGVGQQQSVAHVFDILTRGESGVAQQFEAVMKQEVEAVEAMVEDAGQHNVSLDRLAICLGSDLRAMYPLVMNFGVEGELTVSGPAHPDQVRVRGTVRLPSGDVNLVATQLALDREHANLVTFHPEQSPGLDPVVDLVMLGGDLRVAIQGKASEWQDHLTLHFNSSKARPDSGEALGPADAARVFEDKLKAALLAEDGQLALSRLAGTTVSTLMPKIETQGQVGGTRWRLVSAPSIPGLLSLDPSLADPSNIFNSITMGTEVEVQFGKKLQAALTRKLQESDVTTQWSLTYKLNSKLRMQFNITSAPPFPKTLMFQFSSEGAGST